MLRMDRVPAWFSFESLRPALITGLLLYFASYAMDLILYRLNIPGAATILNDVAVGLLGAILVLFYLSASYESQIMARARERMIMVAELNLHIRNALTLTGLAATLEDRQERLRLVDEASARIDKVLTELVPTAGSADGPRFFLECD